MLRRTLPMCLAGILVACGGSEAPDAQPAATDPPAAATAAPSSAESAPAAAAPTTDGQPLPSNAADPNVFVPAALEFSAPLLGGGDIELTTLAGRPVLLWFWAPW